MSELDLTRPFTRADAVRAGVDPKILRTSRFRRLFRMVYVRKDAFDKLTRPRAALAAHPPAAFISHHSAARIFGLPVPNDPNEHITVLRDSDRRPRLGIKCHVTTGEPDVVVHRGMRISHPYRLFVEMAGVLDLVNLVVFGDAFLRVFAIPPERLREACFKCNRHHAAAARRAAAYVRAGVDSPMESLLRMLLVLAGLPEPEVNRLLRDDWGNVRRRLDLCYPLIKLIIEYDGRQHAESTKQWGVDLDRREEFDEDGWRILIVRSDGIYKRPEETILRVHRQLIARGWPDVPKLRDDWRPFFPGRTSERRN